MVEHILNTQMADGIYGTPSYNGANEALQEALRKLANLDAENSLLRKQVSDANERNDDLNVCFRTTEIELKHAMKKEVERYQKEANIRVSGSVRSISSCIIAHLRPNASKKSGIVS